MGVVVFSDRRSRGFTLLEVLVAMLILLFGMLGSMMAFTTVSERNLQNALRNEAVHIAQEHLERVRNTRYDAVPVGQNIFPVQRQFRKGFHMFNITQTVVAGTNMKHVTVIIQWSFRERNFTYSSETLLGEFS